jgi:hypothetical protein
VPAQRGDAERGQRYGATAAALRIVVVQDATAALRLLTDVQDAVVEVEIGSAKADDLSPAQTHSHGEHEGCIERIPPGRRKEVQRLVQAPGLQLPVVRAGRLDQLGDVARDQFLAAGGGQSGTEHAVGLLGRCRGGLLLQADEEAAYIRDADGWVCCRFG